MSRCKNLEQGMENLIEEPRKMDNSIITMPKMKKTKMKDKDGNMILMDYAGNNDIRRHS